MKYTRFIYLAVIVALVVALLPLAGAVQAQTTLPTASQVASQIQVGWNLGNTLEAQCGETAWGNPMVTQQFIDSVKAGGFNAIRIPAAWDCHANQTTFEIDAAWMARVKQVVDYAINDNMYVVLNIHWDDGWLEEHPLYSYQTAVNQKQNAYWTQIANTFKNYNEHLLFAGTNEVHADYGEPTAEHIAVQQSYNQTFVNAVRATGGNNASRTLVVQTYNTNMWHGLHYFTMPTDTIANRLIVEVHYYDPYDYTLNSSGSCLAWGAPYTQYPDCSWAQEAYMNDLFAQVRAKWVDAGVPVIIGEYAVGMRPNLDLASRLYYLRYFNSTAYGNGMKTFYWDIGVPPTQNGGDALFDRNSGAVVDADALYAVLTGAGYNDPLRTNTPGPSPTRTNTPLPPTATSTTPAGATCSPLSGSISSPYSYDGAGTFCWQSNNLGDHINSWNLNTLKINGVDFTNTYVGSGSYPAQINGYWYLSYNSSVAWGHVEVVGTGGPTNTPAPATNTPVPPTNTQPVVNTPTRTNTPVGPTNTLTPTKTITRTPTFDITITPTRSNTPVPATNTPSAPTSTPTRTPTSIPSNTPVPPTATPTSSGSSGTCSPVDATISAPFTKDGAGTFCWQSSNLGSYTNNWNMTSLTINGVNFTNVYVASSSYPAKINGYWYVVYNGPYPWSHFEAK